MQTPSGASTVLGTPSTTGSGRLRGLSAADLAQNVYVSTEPVNACLPPSSDLFHYLQTKHRSPSMIESTTPDVSIQETIEEETDEAMEVSTAPFILHSNLEDSLQPSPTISANSLVEENTQLRQELKEMQSLLVKAKLQIAEAYTSQEQYAHALNQKDMLTPKGMLIHQIKHLTSTLSDKDSQLDQLRQDRESLARELSNIKDESSRIKKWTATPTKPGIFLTSLLGKQRTSSVSSTISDTLTSPCTYTDPIPPPSTEPVTPFGLKGFASHNRRSWKQETKLISVWHAEILPNFSAIKHTKQFRALWWRGVPSSIRGQAWHLALGNPLKLTRELYGILSSKAKEALESEMHDTNIHLIHLDITRTFPDLAFFAPGGECHDSLFTVLCAFSTFRPDLGYVQGMSYLAAMLLLYMDEFSAFQSLTTLMHRRCVYAMFTMEVAQMERIFDAFETLLDENIHDVSIHLQTLGIQCEMYLVDWLMTMFTRSLPLDCACRLWDLYMLMGDVLLFRGALGVLKLMRQVILASEFETCMHELRNIGHYVKEHSLVEAVASMPIKADRLEQLLSGIGPSYESATPGPKAQ